LLESGFSHQLVDAISALPERDQLLLNLYYEEELNLREIGAVLEVSQSRVCQLHSQAISRLRAKLKDVL
jgi:RNA polymerase sigma factor for flagellar operon FliA